MPKMTDIPLASSSEIGRNIKNTGELLVNMMAVVHKSMPKKQVTLQSTAGFSELYSFDNQNILAIHTVKEDIYIVTNTNLYGMSSSGVSELGVVNFPANPKSISIADNGFDIVFVADRGYKYNIESTTLENYDEDTAYFPSMSVTFLDGYFVFARKDTMQFFLSDLYSTTLDALSYASKEANPDDLMGVIASNRALWLIGKRSTEIWTNIGSSIFPFLRVAGAVHENGTNSVKTIKSIDGSIFFLGSDGAVYQSNGYQLAIISTEAIESRIRKQSITDAEAFTYNEEGHSFYCLTINSLITFVYDLQTGLWHNRSSQRVQRWRIKDIVQFTITNRNIGIDFTNGKMYEVDLDITTEDEVNITRTIQSIPIHNEVNYVTMSEYQIDMATGSNDEATKEGIIKLQFSDDGNTNWSNIKEASVGKRGDTNKRVIFRRLGRFRQRTMRIIYQEPTSLYILGSYGRMTNAE